jgi:hypothetical protein
MKRTLKIFFFLIACTQYVKAAHIKGGELYYRYVGVGASPETSVYTVTLKLYIDCAANSPGQLDAEISLTVFDNLTNAVYLNKSAFLDNERFLRFDPASNPCIGNPPLDVCYRVRTYSTSITVKNTTAGYTIAYQRCCRIIDIRNLNAPSNSSGATYSATIPGTSKLPDAYKNSSPTYVTNDAAAICRGSAFTFSFAADEPDGTDSVEYSLCNGFIGASQSVPNPTVASTPPYQSLSYSNGYSGSLPLGPNVTINPKTGLVTGVAPNNLGQFVITACASEFRNGVLINIHRKDIHIAVSDCIPLKALLKPDYSFCDDLLVNFKNEQANPPGAEYTWNFGDGTGDQKTVDALGRLTHQYVDTGTYIVKLKVILAGQCIDSTTTRAKVYPGFFPGFVPAGSCLYTPFAFTDTTKSRYGKASIWHWDFGDTGTDDTANTKTANWLYSSLGLKRVELIVESDKGCRDTVSSQIEVRDIPLMSLAFRDTLICSVDSVQLQLTGNGVISWSPTTNLIGPSLPNPIVYPKTTTTFKVTLNENGCVNTDSVRVRVVDFVTLNAGADSTICLTDSARLNPITDALQFSWSPAASLSDPTAKQPFAFPGSQTTYTVTGSIGKCKASDNVTIRTIPYPFADAGADTTICYRDTAILRGVILGSGFNWSPSNTLEQPNSLLTAAFPSQPTVYRLTAFDTLGCPKPGFDDVLVNVREKINAFAGNDTAIVIGQPLQLSGQGAELFEWTPPLGLSNRNISNPLALLDQDIVYTLKAYTAEGCFSLDTMKVTVFKTSPDIFMPNAFAPEGKNRLLKPITPGISRLEYFRVFNRWGQLMFSTQEFGKGWDGTVAGRLQDTGTYVWMVSGKDYTGKTVTKKGTATLIR